MIRMEGVSKKYDDLYALRSLNLNLAPGQVLGLIGPNGAGKTTLIKILAGLLKPDEGRVFLNDIDIKLNPSTSRMSVGWMPDFFGMYNELTVYEVLSFFASACRLPEKSHANKIHSVLESVNLLEKKSRRISELSRGMIQRVCLARTLLHEPSILLLDEPASGLDPHTRIELRQLFRSLISERRVLLISSHILTELEDLCTHIAILEKGNLLYFGPSDQVSGIPEPESDEPDSEEKSDPQVSVQIEIDCHTEQRGILKKALKSSSKISDLSALGPFKIILKPSEDPAALLRELVNQGIPITHFRQDHSLENTFLRITQGGGQRQ